MRKKELIIEIIKKFKLPILLVFVIWMLKLIEIIFSVNFNMMGVYPGKINSLFGIFLFPLIHGSISHAFLNTIPLVLLGYSLNTIFQNSAKYVWLLGYFIPGIFIWFFGRAGYHIGASGLVYCLWAFIFFSGIIRRDKRSAALSLLVLFLYGSLIIGIFPIKTEVSWEGHLAGFVTGLLMAVLFRKRDVAKRYDWEDEESSNEKLEISYSKNETNKFL